jgi:hypothetical protein
MAFISSIAISELDAKYFIPRKKNPLTRAGSAKINLKVIQYRVSFYES